MTSSKSSSSPPADPQRDGVEQFHPHRYIYSFPPQLTLVDVLAMQPQAQAPPTGFGFTTMPIWTAGDTAPSSSDEREVLGRSLEALLAVLDSGTIPSGRNRNAGGGRGSADRPKTNSPQNSPREPKQ
jgi:hypothetical protein